jgi:segregation and condensation protein B
MAKELNFIQSELALEITPIPEKNCQIQEAQAELLNLSPKDSFDQIESQVRTHVKRVVEALLFSCPEPLSIQKIREVTDTFSALAPRHLRRILEELQQEYISQQRAFRLEEIAQGYVLRTHEEYAPYIEILQRQKRGEKLSPAGTEVLAIIAYRQPITRPQIDAIRGVDSSGTLMQLLERQLVETQGKLEAPGRPTLYVTTKEFLKHFGFKDHEDFRSRLSM